MMIPIATDEDFREMADWIASLADENAKYSPDQPRDYHGRFGHGSGDVVPPLPDITPGATDVGAVNANTLGRVLGSVEGSEVSTDSITTLWTPPEVQEKVNNVKEIGRELEKRARKDPGLREQLGRTAANVIASGISSQSSTLQFNTNGLLEGSSPNIYQRDHLHLTEGMSVEEVGGREIAARMQDTWMNSASDSQPLSWAMQIAAANLVGVDTSAAHAYLDEFGLLPDDAGQVLGLPPQPPVQRYSPPPGEEWHSPDAIARANRLAESPAVKEYVDIVYNRTQSFLEEHEIGSEVTLFRGVNILSTTAPGSTESVTMNPLSSFSVDEHTAKTFAGTEKMFALDEPSDSNGTVYRATIPASRIFSLAVTGPGCLSESEAIIIGGPAKVEVV